MSQRGLGCSMCVMRSLPGVPGMPLGPPRPLSPSKPGDPGKPAKTQQSECVCLQPLLRFFPVALPRLLWKQKVNSNMCIRNISLTFGSRTSRTCRQTGRSICSSPSWVAGLALRPGETRGACRGDEAITCYCLTVNFPPNEILSGYLKEI